MEQNFAEHLKKVELLSQVFEEVNRAETIHPMYPSDIIEQLAIMQEESGEVAKAVLDYKYDGGKYEDIKTELIQTAAMCIRMLMNLKEDKALSSKLLNEFVYINNQKRVLISSITELIDKVSEVTEIDKEYLLGDKRDDILIAARVYITQIAVQMGYTDKQIGKALNKSRYSIIHYRLHYKPTLHYKLILKWTDQVITAL